MMNKKKIPVSSHCRDRVVLPAVLQKAAHQKAQEMGISFSELIVQAIEREIMRTQDKHSLKTAAGSKEIDDTRKRKIKMNLSKAIQAGAYGKAMHHLKLAGELLVEESFRRTPQNFNQWSGKLQIHDNPIVMRGLIELAMYTFYQTSPQDWLSLFEKLPIHKKDSRSIKKSKK